MNDESAITESEHIKRIITAHLIDINTRFVRSEQIGAFELVTESWAPATVFLTDTGKMKRASIREYYVNHIERMYAAPDIRAVRTPQHT